MIYDDIQIYFTRFEQINFIETRRIMILIFKRIPDSSWLQLGKLEVVQFVFWYTKSIGEMDWGQQNNKMLRYNFI